MRTSHGKYEQVMGNSKKSLKILNKAMENAKQTWTIRKSHGKFEKKVMNIEKVTDPIEVTDPIKHSTMEPGFTIGRVRGVHY